MTSSAYTRASPLQPGVAPGSSPERHPLSQAIRDLRAHLGISQQQFAFETHTAVRTIARWENNQPPRGKWLVQLAQLAGAHGLDSLRDVFYRALERDVTRGPEDINPELKTWLDAMHVIFRYRRRAAPLWDRVAKSIAASLEFIVKVNEDEETEDFELKRLQKQLNSLNGRMGAMERFLNREASQIACDQDLSYEVAWRRVLQNPVWRDDYLRETGEVESFG